jgi:hypothetical protein
MNRRLEAFRTKVQFEIDAANDRIDRLSGYLSSVNADIVLVKDRLRSFQLRFDQEKEMKDGEKKRKSVEVQERSVLLQADHQAQICAMEEAHSETLKSMCCDFEKKYAQLKKKAEILSASRTKVLSALIETAQNQLNAIQKSIKNSKFHVDASEIVASDVENERIEILETSLRDKSEDRLGNLTMLKQKLSDVLTILEEREEDHTLAMNRLKSKLERINTDYDMAVNLKDKQREKQMELGKRKIEQAEARVLGYHNQISRMQEKQAVELMQIAVSKDILRSQFGFQSATTNSKKSRVGLDKNSQLMSELEKRESILKVLRNQNEELKRNIAALRDEERFAERNMILGLH